MTDVKELMRGGYDLHVHSAPDCLPRKMDDIDMAKRITDSTLAGYAIKNHWTSTAGRAQLINKMFPGCDAVGTITLNSAVGGLNPTAVEMAARGGVKLVWFPTCDNEHEMAYQFDGNPNKKRAFWASIILEMKEQGIVTPTLNCLDESGELKQEVLDILDIIARYDMILATGHISHEEAFKLVPEAAKRGVKKIELGFPVYSRGFMPCGPIKKNEGNINTPIMCAGVKVAPGDLVVGDSDGVCVIPKEHISALLAAAEEKKAYESKRRETIAAYREARKNGTVLPQLAPQWVLDMMK